MDIRDALTTPRKHQALHKTTAPATLTACGFRIFEIEPEEPGRRAEWRRKTRDMRTCHRCDLWLERQGETARA